jgi:hypothetical protein
MAAGAVGAGPDGSGGPGDVGAGAGYAQNGVSHSDGVPEAAAAGRAIGPILVGRGGQHSMIG